MTLRFWHRPLQSCAATVIAAVAFTVVLAPSPAGALITPYPVNGDGDTMTRYWDLDRYGTSVQIALSTTTACSTAVVTTGEAFPDALASAGIATASTPIMLVPRAGTLPASVASYLDGCTAVTVVGGPNAVSTGTVTQVSSLTTVSTVLAGANRYETAARVARVAGTGLLEDLSGTTPGTPIPTVIMATGEDFPDALAAGPLASRLGMAVLLTQPSTIPAVTQAVLAALAPQQVILMGGTVAVNPLVQDQLAASGVKVKRFAGANRYETATLLNSAVIGLPITGPSTTSLLNIGLANFENFADALAAGPFLGNLTGGLGLIYGSQPSSVPTVTVNALKATANLGAPQGLSVFGGTVAVSDPAALAAHAAIDSTVP
jgi:putative cell wall-binding protein